MGELKKKFNSSDFMQGVSHRDESQTKPLDWKWIEWFKIDGYPDKIIRTKIWWKCEEIKKNKGVPEPKIGKSERKSNGISQAWWTAGWTWWGSSWISICHDLPFLDDMILE